MRKYETWSIQKKKQVERKKPQEKMGQIDNRKYDDKMNSNISVIIINVH